MRSNPLPFYIPFSFSRKTLPSPSAGSHFLFFSFNLVALSLEKHHNQAIKIRKEQTLPIYEKKLGEHPFTATIYNILSKNFCALVEFDQAKPYSEIALEIRRKLLNEHMDTAKSLFDLGMVHKERGDFQQAITYLPLQFSGNLSRMNKARTCRRRCWRTISRIFNGKIT